MAQDQQVRLGAQAREPGGGVVAVESPFSSPRGVVMVSIALAVFFHAASAGRAATPSDSERGTFSLRATIDGSLVGRGHWQEELEIVVPTSRPGVAQLRAHRPGDARHQAALVQLLRATGFYPSGALGAERDAPIELTIANGLAKIRLPVQRWNVNGDERGPCFGLSLDSSTMAGQVELQLRDLTLESVAPLPDYDNGRRVVWRLPRADVDELRACTAVPEQVIGWRRGIRERSGWWGFVGLAVGFVPTVLYLGVAAFLLTSTRWLSRGATGPNGIGALIVRATIVVLGVLAVQSSLEVLIGAIAIEYDYDFPTWASALQEGTIATAVVLPAAATAWMVVVARRAAGGGRTWALAAVAVAVIGLIVAPFIAESVAVDPVYFDVDAPRAVDGAAAGSLLLLTLVLPVLAFWVTAVLAIRTLQTDRTRRTDRLVLILVLVGVALAAHALAGGVDNAREFAGPSGVLSTIPAVLFLAPLNVLWALLAQLQFALLIAAVLWIRHAGSIDRSSLSERLLLAAAVGLVFGRCVVGLGGGVASLGLPVPLPFVLTLAAITAVVLIGSRTRGPEEPGDHAPADVIPATPWQQGLESVGAGLLLAIIPIGFYLYVLLSDRFGPALELRPGFAPLYLGLALIYEVIYWLGAAATLGWLSAYLPGRYVALKAVSLGLIYVGALGLSDLVLDVPPEWIFRSFALGVFLVLVGIRLDHAALARDGKSWADLPSAYRLGTVKGLATAVFPLAIAVVGLGDQIWDGHADDAIRDFLTGLPDVLPGAPESPD